MIIDFVGNDGITVETLGGAVSCKVSPDGRSVTVEMGKVSFDSTKIPVLGEPRDVLNEEIEINGRILKFCAATVGNPHCIVHSENPTPDQAKRYGPLIEVEPRFPQSHQCAIYEGAGSTITSKSKSGNAAPVTHLASGSSSTAAAAVAHKLGLCDQDITVHMPGGEIFIQFSNDFLATMTGPVTKVCEGVIADEMFEESLFE
jgi:diaminopimelate epimerase